jgi:hypothetical protein
VVVCTIARFIFREKSGRDDDEIEIEDEWKNLNFDRLLMGDARERGKKSDIQ